MAMVGQALALELRPHKHQVGGHGTMLELNNQLVCKPFTENEFQLYRKLLKNPNLRTFVPDCYGILNTHHDQFEGADDRLMVKVKRADERVAALLDSCRRVKENDSEAELVPFRVNGSTMKYSTNPWAKECFSRAAQKFKDAPLKDETKFIVLENLTTKLTHPSVLDLKLGTRTYADWATDAKKAKMVARAKESTSEAFGLRLSGMQVYESKSREYRCWDKYFGRSLSGEGLVSMLDVFIAGAPTNVCRQLLDKLVDLKKCVAREAEYRFYSSSLLLIYGADGSHTVDVRMIDFANTSYAVDLEPTYDEGFMLGLDTLISLLSSML